MRYFALKKTELYLSIVLANEEKDKPHIDSPFSYDNKKNIVKDEKTFHIGTQPRAGFYSSQKYMKFIFNFTSCNVKTKKEMIDFIKGCIIIDESGKIWSLDNFHRMAIPEDYEDPDDYYDLLDDCEDEEKYWIDGLQVAKNDIFNKTEHQIG